MIRPIGSISRPLRWDSVLRGTSSTRVATYQADGQTHNIFADGFPGTGNAIGMSGFSYLADLIPVPVKIDDTWHAGINGRGGYLSAGDPAALEAAFKQILGVVSTAATESTAAAVSLSTGSAASSALLYQARLNSGDWSGDVRSFRISAGKLRPPCGDKPRGFLCEDPGRAPPWRSAADTMAADNQNGPDHRYILTFGNTTTAIEFKSSNWASLTEVQQRDFLTEDDGTSVHPADATSAELAKAKARLDYVAGDRTYEQDGRAYRFRTRRTVLGDFINAGPVVVGPPALYYTLPGYSNATQQNVNGFKQQYASRTPLVYAGANDGMLHAFRADTLKEAFAFVPPVLMGLADTSGTVEKRPGLLHLLSDPAYGGSIRKDHQPMVDGPIATGDVQFGSTYQGTWQDWHTVLVGALGLGAQALYALDVTDPPTNGVADSAFANRMFLWQFTDRGLAANRNFWDPHLG